MAMNVRQAAKAAITDWVEDNPRQSRETLRQYRSRARQGIEANLRGEHGSPVWLTILLQLLPLLLELFIK